MATKTYACVLFGSSIVDGGLAELTGSSRAKFVVVKDRRVGEHTHEPRAQLRSLPLLFHFGLDTVVHTPVWNNDFKPIDYTHLDPNEVAAEEMPFPLVHVVSQDGLLEALVREGEVAEGGEQHLVRRMLRRRTDDDTYVIVSDTDAPKTPTYAERPITDDFGPVTTVDYEATVDRIVQTTLDSHIPLGETRNYWYHRISDHHGRHGAPADPLPALFDYDRAPPNSPAWLPLYYFVEYDLEEILDKYTERIREALRSWTERGDVQKIANNMDSMLVRCKFRSDDLDAQRRRNASLYGLEETDLEEFDVSD